MTGSQYHRCEELEVRKSANGFKRFALFFPSRSCASSGTPEAWDNPGVNGREIVLLTQKGLARNQSRVGVIPTLNHVLFHHFPLAFKYILSVDMSTSYSTTLPATKDLESTISISLITITGETHGV